MTTRGPLVGGPGGDSIRPPSPITDPVIRTRSSTEMVDIPVPPSPGGGTQPPPPQEPAPPQAPLPGTESSFDAVAAVLAAFPWLQELGEQVYDLLVTGVVNDEPYDVIIQNIRNTDTYKTRFAGLIQRRSQNLPAISEAEYLQVELGYMNQLRNFNILGTLGLTDTAQFRSFAAGLIGSDVSVAELNARLDQGVAVMRDSSDYVRDAFQQFYGMQPSDDALLVYFLDPDRGTSIIEDQVAAARIGAEAFRFGLNINRTKAELLEKEGITAEFARQGFADIAREEPLLRRLAQIHNYIPLGQDELEQFFFHEDPEVGARRMRTFSQAIAAFGGSGATNVARTGGLTELLDRDRMG